MTNVTQHSMAINSALSGTSLAATIRSMAHHAGQDCVVAITPEIAGRVLAELKFVGQREIRRPRVNEKLSLIRSGAWSHKISTITIAELPDGSMVSIDGHHRLTAIVEHGIPVHAVLRVVKAECMEEVRRLYAMFDQKSSVRTDSELLSASGLSSMLGIKFKTADILLKAVVVIDNGMEPEVRGLGREHLTRFDYRQSLAPAWDSEARDFEAVVDKADVPIRRKLLRAGTMAVALYTLRHQRDLALQFWHGLAENDGLRRTDPRARLLSDLISRAVDSGARRQSVQQSVIAWNAFYEGRELKIIKCIEGAEIVIAGTPMRKAGAK